MRVHVLQHVPFEGLGSIEPWLAQRDTEIRYTRFFERDPLPDLDAVDLLVAMGGPMSVNDVLETTAAVAHGMVENCVRSW